ncbi:S-layer family protein [Chromatium okenii]|uniref:beta strand repeat-containing protein n=1 Tax=Chromatium okenii TaxID=61644 RepID=UPI0026EDFC82|nr:choice-of-anchor U domain-containing protein [Chromatium okenii]MBV5309134.1 cadherin repeat domain-containing protein [Chromatium okenii]
MLVASDFGYTDTGEGSPLATVKMTTLNVVGALKYSVDGTTWLDVTLNQEISKTDIDAGKLKFIPVANANGLSYATFNFKVSDGTDYSTSENTITINVTAVNDAPTISAVPSSAQAVTTGQSAALADFTVADIDSNTLSVTLRATNGKIGNLTDVDANTAGIQLTGLAQTINQDLADATFIALDAGEAKISISVSDQAANATADYLFTASTPVQHGQDTFVSGGKTNTLSIDDGELGTVTVSSAPSGLPRGVKMPLGQIGFTVNNLANGGVANISLNVDKSFKVDSYYKKNLVTNVWTKLPATITTTGEVTTISFSLQDGGVYDSDRLANGTIVDPGVIAQDLLKPTVAENTVFATDVSQILETSELATLQGAVSYTLNGGDDVAKFTMDSQTGVLKFIAAPDFENPTDTDVNNSYSVNVRVTGATNGTVDKPFVINVANDEGVNNVITNLAGDNVSIVKNTANYIDADLNGDNNGYAQVATFPASTLNGYLLISQTSGTADGTLSYANSDWTNLGFNSTTKEFTFNRSGTPFVGAKIDTDLNGENGKALKINFLEDANGLLVSANEYTILIQYLQYQSATLGERTFSAFLNNGSEQVEISPFSEAVSFSVNVTGQAAVIANLLPANTFTEDGQAVAIASTVTIVDSDDTHLNSLTVKISNPLNGSDEQLTMNGQASTITANYDATSGTMTLSGVDTVANYQAALRLINYQNSNQNPDVTDRILEIVATDASLQTSTVTTTVNVLAVNDAPTISNVPSSAQAVTTWQYETLPNFTVADIDSTNLTVTLTATGGVIGSVTDADSSNAGIQLTGTAATINAALANASFMATSAGGVTVGISVTDGVISTPTTATYNLTAYNAPEPEPTPVITITGADGKTVTLTTINGTTTIPNPIKGSTVNVTNSGNTIINNPSDLVTLNNTGSGTVTTSGMTGNTTLNVTGTGLEKIDMTGMKLGNILTIDNRGSGVVDLSNLPDGVVVNLLGTGPVVLNDTDGATASIENIVPALTGGTIGDGNGDGTPDALQSNVASLSFLKTSTSQSNPSNATSVFVSLIADANDGKIDTTDKNTAQLNNVHQIDAPVNLPKNVKMPLGQISFDAKVDAVGTNETFSLYVDSTLGINAYWKQNAAGNWVNLASSQYGGKVVTEGGKTRLDFQITDGGVFDSDGKADGVITDPGAPGFDTNIPPTLTGLPATVQTVTTGIAAELDNVTLADVNGDKLSVTLTTTNGSITGLIDADINTAGIQLTGSADSINNAIAAAKFTATQAGAASMGMTISDGIASAVTGTYSLLAVNPITATLESAVNVLTLAPEYANLTLLESTFDKTVTSKQLVDNPLACLPTWTLKILKIPLKISQEVTTIQKIVEPLNGSGNNLANKIMGNSAANSWTGGC